VASGGTRLSFAPTTLSTGRSRQQVDRAQAERKRSDQQQVAADEQIHHLLEYLAREGNMVVGPADERIVRGKGFVVGEALPQT
jgi:hypothetical protein